MRVFVIAAVIAAAVWALNARLGRWLAAMERRRGGAHEMIKDPVCGTFVPVTQAVSRQSGNAVRYYCSDTCARKDGGG